MRNILFIFFFLLFASDAAAQPGPSPTPSPWLQNGPTLSYDTGGVTLPSTVTGGSKGVGTINAQAIYINNIPVLTSVPVTSVFGRTGAIIAGSGDYSFSLISGTAATAQLPTGTSVANPGTGKLESLLPIQTVNAASKTFATADMFYETRRTNGGSAMTDTFPASSATGMVNGTRITVSNADASATDTITAGSGTTFPTSSTDVVEAGRSITYVYDAGAAIWRKTYNTGIAAILSSTGSNTIGDLVAMNSIYGAVADSGISKNSIAVCTAWATPVFNAGNFVGTGGTWTVISGNIGTNSWMQCTTGTSKWMSVVLEINSTTVASTPSLLNITLPNSAVATSDAWYVGQGIDNGTLQFITCKVVAGQSVIACAKSGSNWSASTTSTSIRVTLSTFQIN